MMYEILYRYLIKHKKIDLPGIGVFAVQVQAAEAEVVDHYFLPPRYSFQFEQTDEMPPEKLFSWLASRLDTTEQEAVIRFNDFILNLNRQLKEGKEIRWQGVGVLRKEFSGEINFIPVRKEFPWIEKVAAEKITRQNAEHTMLVGENEKTSTEMHELLLAGGDGNTHYWWVWPLAVILAVSVFLGLYFSENNNPNPSGNNQKISPAEAPGFNLNSR
jgi:nucleoid DNA-binding protein